MPAARRILLIILVLFLLVLLFAVPSVSFAQVPTPPSPLGDAAKQFAAKIAAFLPSHKFVQFTVQNKSSLDGAEADYVRVVIEDELKRNGYLITQGSTEGMEVRVTLAENFNGYLWVAETMRPEEKVLAMFVLPHPPVVPGFRTLPDVSIKKELLWVQERQILDLALDRDTAGGLDRLFVLEPTQLVLYRQDAGQWKPSDTYALPLPRPLVRDPIGRLRVLDGIIGVSLPGLDCDAVAAPKPGKMQCAPNPLVSWMENDSPLPFRAKPDLQRNYNEAVSFPDSSVQWRMPAFYSAAPIETHAEPIWLFAGIDGRTRLYAGKNAEPELVIAGWGEDVTSLNSDCGDGWQILASRAGDWTKFDAVTAYEFLHRQIVAVSPTIEFSGPITALWAPHRGGSALAIVRNLKTGRYEAYRLTISCAK